MTSRTATALMLLLIGLGTVVRGQAPSPTPCGPTWFQGCARVPTCCPNDYLPKALPSVFRAMCGGIHDYCPKPLPGVVRVPTGCVNDYVPKACPVCLPLNTLGWKCGPSECVGQGR